MNKNKAFTLIELLAVIIILGLLMAIAIPSISKYIEQSRKKTYINTAQSYVDGLSRELAVRGIRLDDETVSYYIPFNCIPLERGGKSPNGDWDFGYVGLSINNGKRKYYIYSKDVKGMGIPSLEINNIKYTDVETITTSKEDLIALDGKTTLLVVPDTCDYNNLIVKDDVPWVEPPESCFNIDDNGEISWKVSKTNNNPNKSDPCYTEHLSLPSTVNGQAVIRTGFDAFSYYDLKSVSVPQGVSIIRYCSFCNNQITTVKIPNTVTSIASYAFQHNELESVSIPPSITNISTHAFTSNPLEQIIFLGRSSTDGITLGNPWKSSGTNVFP